MIKKSIILILTCLSCFLSFAQTASQAVQLEFEVNQVFEPLSISRSTLETAKTLKALNPNFESDWVDAYLQVDFYAWHGNKQICKTNQSDIMSSDQLALIKRADVNSYINVEVQYLPKNNLKENTPKLNHFRFKVNPDQRAQYAEGREALHGFIKEKIVSKVDPSKFKEYQLAAVKFTIDKNGDLKDVTLLESSNDDAIDALMLDAIRKMNAWKPATFFDGTSVAQDFVFTIGDHRSCIIPTLHTRRFAHESH